MTMTESNKIGIVGSGLIGRSWAMIFASAGYKVSIYDILEEQINTALREIEKELNELESLKLLRGSSSAQEQIKLICGCSDLKNLVDNALLVQECVTERVDLKQKVFADIDAVADDNVIIASSTSTFLPSILSENLKHRDQFLVAHPINPPYHVPLVEIVPAPWTKPEVSEKMFSIMQKVGQVPIKLKKEIEGFALNRMQFAVINECFHLVQDNILDAESVDKVVTEALGLRYAFLGPLETTHLNANGFRDYCERYGPGVYAVSQTFKPAPEIVGPTVDQIANSLEKRVPLEKLADRRKWRDDSLIKLSQLKKSNS